MPLFFGVKFVFNYSYKPHCGEKVIVGEVEIVEVAD
jgi:hypothetical protein